MDLSRLNPSLHVNGGMLPTLERARSGQATSSPEFEQHLQAASANKAAQATQQPVLPPGFVLIGNNGHAYPLPGLGTVGGENHIRPQPLID